MKMTMMFPSLLVAGSLWAWGAQPKLNVVATLPDFGALVEAVGGPWVSVTSLTRGTEDPHFVDPRPSFIRVLNRADVLVQGGADLEVGWLPPLLNNARNPEILPGRSRNVSMAEGLQLLEIPAGPVDRSQGDVHPLGNPHYWLDPLNLPIMARHLAEVLGRLDPGHAADFQENAAKVAARVEEKLPLWTKSLESLRGVRVLTYHKTFEYFARRFGLEIVGQIEPLPGIEPSPSHMASLVPRAKTAGVRLILVEGFRPERTSKAVAESIGAKVVVVPDKVGCVEEVKDNIALFDRIVSTLRTAMAEP